MSRATLWTIGHSVRPIDTLLDMLDEAGIRHVVDVRRLPRSRRHPHFNRDALERALAGRGIGYTHVPELGGLREPRPDSPHKALREPAFRGYADHMQSPEFESELAALLGLAETAATAFLCAEANPRDCHRRLIADALVARGNPVVHLLAPGTTAVHELSPEARVSDGRVTYPAPDLFG